MKIDVNHNRNIDFWAGRLGVTRARLIAAVAAAGPDAQAVEAWLLHARTSRPRSARREASRRLAFHSFD
jgi:hypothetical protein